MLSNDNTNNLEYQKKLTNYNAQLNMVQKADSIAELLADYQNNTMTSEHILNWVSQFEDSDQEFILEELLHIFKQTYLSKENCKKRLKNYIEYWLKEFKYVDVPSFIKETVFLDLQPAHKSQKELLKLLNEVLINEYNCDLSLSGQIAKRYIYLDDVLSTGGTIFRNLNDWFKSPNLIEVAKTNFEYISDKNIKICICLLCCHKWGQTNTEYRLMQSLDVSVKNSLRWFWIYLIENNAKDYNQSLNHMLPIDDNLPLVHDYLNSLNATANADRAFRQSIRPLNEKLFSNIASRSRIETLFLVKGIEILLKVKELKVSQLRPLGYTVKSHKTFGLGTLFFTYRNIPNNCPIVFWWANNNWRPLFVVKNRGN